MLRLDYEAMEDSANQLTAHGQTFEDTIQQMSSVVHSLPNIWEADTCNRYVEQFDEIKPKMDEMRQLIEDLSLQMKKIAQNFREADASMASQM